MSNGQGMYINLQGMDDAIKQLRRIERGTKAMERYQGQVFSKLPYAWGAEFGRHRKTNKLARRAGGAHYLSRAIDDMSNGVDRDLSEGLEKVTGPGPWVLKRLGLWTRRLARKYAPRRTVGRDSRGRFVSKSNKTASYRLHKSINYRVVKE